REVPTETCRRSRCADNQGLPVLCHAHSDTGEALSALHLTTDRMIFADLQEFLRHLEQRGQLRRVRAEVDPELEVTEITQRVLREQGPALLFERPKGSSMPLVMNLFGTMDRVKAALGREPAQIGNELIEAFQRVNPPSLKGIWESRNLIKRALFT